MLLGILAECRQVITARAVCSTRRTLAAATQGRDFSFLSRLRELRVEVYLSHDFCTESAAYDLHVSDGYTLVDLAHLPAALQSLEVGCTSVCCLTHPLIGLTCTHRKRVRR